MKFAEGDKVVTDSIDIVTKSVVKYMIKSGRKLCTAESCTGGMISQTITSVSGASEMFLGGACTYTEEIKMKLLNVKKETLEQIKRKYSVLIVSDDDVVDAFNLVNDIMTAEADAIKEREPTATASISRLESAAYEVFSIGGDIENENFSEGE